MTHLREYVVILLVLVDFLIRILERGEGVSMLTPSLRIIYLTAQCQTMLNNSRSHSMVQATVPNPAWGTASSDRLGFDGSSKLIAKRYLAGGINGTTHGYANTTPVVGFTTQYDLAGNKMYERELHAETRSHLHQPFDGDGVPLNRFTTAG